MNSTTVFLGLGLLGVVALVVFWPRIAGARSNSPVVIQQIPQGGNTLGGVLSSLGTFATGLSDVVGAVKGGNTGEEPMK